MSWNLPYKILQISSLSEFPDYSDGVKEDLQNSTENLACQGGFQVADLLKSAA